MTGQCLQNYDGAEILINQRIVNGKDLTIEKCLETCKFEKYAGLGNGGNCFCGDELHRKTILPES